MPQPQTAPYGSWKSPITSDLIVSETIGLTGVMLDGNDVYWIEGRPAEGGRSVIVRRTPDGRTTDLTPTPFNARTRVHEYGGGAFVVSDQIVYFSNFADQRFYRQDPDQPPRPVTPEAQLRYADGVIDHRRNRMVCVREDHTVDGREAVNTLVSIKLDGDIEGGKILVSGNDFYSSPKLSPDGSQLAWLTWNHPNMPWDGTELWVGEIKPDGTIGKAKRVAGGKSESIFQPEWSPDGTLYFVSDRTSWWNLYRWREGHIEPLALMEAEFGRPQWQFRMSTYAFESPQRMICSYTHKGSWYLASLDTKTLKLDPTELPYSQIVSVRTASGRVILQVASPKEPDSIVELELATRKIKILRRSTKVEIDPGYVSTPRPIEFPTEHSLTAYALFYLPKNRDYAAPSKEKPPLIVMSHGGPTSAVGSTLNLQIQYWTSRGFAVLDVNYGGSTGYGHTYRERLNGQWGVVDVNDCVNGARYVVELGEVDGNRLIIRGGSAGGYTTLCALTFHKIFKAGASYFGVSDLEALAKETHKFESRYLDRLIGPYPARRDLYRKRSPIHFIDRLSCPVIFFQGLEDKAVPPNQAEMMVRALRAKGLPVAYLSFENEGHGFRRAETIKRARDAELYFYSKIFGVALAEPVEPVKIENM
ncbi:S9 family peptidase [Candidatus Acetothermia bacterium]|nr:S9 family peptidase [Candidatus Acetothermia bacterium]